MQITQIVTDETMREVTAHGSKTFPFQYYYYDIKKYDIGEIGWHWHKEFEFLMVEKGSVICLIGNTKIELQVGEGLFVNTGVIHSFKTPKQGCMHNFVFSFELIAQKNTTIYEKFIEPFFLLNISHVVLKSETVWQKEILQYLQEMHEIFLKNKETMEIDIHIKTAQIWSSLFFEQR